MDMNQTDVMLRSIKRIPLTNGDVLRAIKASDSGFSGFGEAYFSYIHNRAIKAWKLHKRYTANFICPFGKVKVMVYKEISPGVAAAEYPKEFILSDTDEQYQCITIPPGIWYGFEGLSNPTSLIFSLLNGEHDQNEQLSLNFDAFTFSRDTVSHD